MAETEISWADYTFNHVRGCIEVSPGCTNCYAREFSKRNPAVLGTWGKDGLGRRVVASERYWKMPASWHANSSAERQIWAAIEHDGGTRSLTLSYDFDEIGVANRLLNMEHRGVVKRAALDRQLWLANNWNSPRVFSASLADAFEDWKGPMVNSRGDQLHRSVRGEFVIGCQEGSVELTMGHVRQRLFDKIDATRNLDWLLLTKRPENIQRMIPKHPVYANRRNLWLGTTVESQPYADARIPELIGAKHHASIAFLSMEPLLGPVDLLADGLVNSACSYCEEARPDPETGMIECGQCEDSGKSNESAIDWVIVGCESGGKRRETKLDWVRDLRDQCRSASVDFFVKQLEIGGKVTTDIDEFPEDLRVREIPCLA